MGASEARMTDYPSLPPDRVVTACDERRDVVLDAVRRARSRISLSLFRCTDKAIFEALSAAVSRGVNVEVMVTLRAKGGKTKLRRLWERLEATGATVHAYNDPVVKYHAKYLVVDDGPALVASLNFTRKCFTRTCDAIVVTYDPEVVAGLRALMRADREGLPLPALTPRLIVGPEKARRQFTTLIEQARTSIHVIDAKVSDPGVITLLNGRRAQGVQVEILSGKRLGGRKSHGKLMLIDGRQAIVGSLALAALSLDFRREVALAIEEPSAVAEISRVFRAGGAAIDVVRPAPATAAGGTAC